MPLVVAMEAVEDMLGERMEKVQWLVVEDSRPAYLEADQANAKTDRIEEAGGIEDIYNPSLEKERVERVEESRVSNSCSKQEKCSKKEQELSC